MKYRWSMAPAQPLLAEQLARQLQLSPLLAQCLLNRAHSSAEAINRFLEPRLKQLADPFLLPNMAAAVERLVHARSADELVVIFGDYDVDGVTSSTLLREVLRALGWRAEAYLPHRIEEGYGLTREGVENCLRRFPAKVLLAVDCGSTANDTIDWLNGQGVEVLVLDHHQTSQPPPKAHALVNPQLAGEGQPDFRELCSVGLSFKLAHALLKTGRDAGWPAAATYDLRPLLDLVALGTIADLVPLQRENRILVAAGLQWLDKTQRPGLIALKEVAQVHSPVQTYEVGYQLAPRLNAAGRLETAEAALQLLGAATVAEAMPLARQLDACNRERQLIERNIATEVIGAVRARFDPARDYVIVEGQLLWHIGVVGIVASRVLHEFYRPTIILGGDAHHWRGSGRSIDGFDLASALRSCADLLVRHGGHAMAAGVSIHPDKVDALRLRLNELARAQMRSEMLQPDLRLDAEADLSQLKPAAMDELARLNPIGQGNPQVQLVVRKVSLQRPPMQMGREQQHLKFWVSNGRTSAECVWWGGGKSPRPEGVFDLACVPQINDYNGRHVQLKLLDWRPAA